MFQMVVPPEEKGGEGVTMWRKQEGSKWKWTETCLCSFTRVDHFSLAYFLLLTSSCFLPPAYFQFFVRSEKWTIELWSGQSIPLAYFSFSFPFPIIPMGSLLFATHFLPLHAADPAVVLERRSGSSNPFMGNSSRIRVSTSEHREKVVVRASTFCLSLLSPSIYDFSLQTFLPFLCIRSFGSILLAHELLHREESY